MSKGKNAISPTRSENYPEWYQEVIKAADLAENSAVRGCMVIKPWGYGIWERLQRELDDRIKATGHSNAYFPLFIPVSFLEKEAAHIDGFAKECAVVTHHRLEARDGKLIPSGELQEPYVVRPTSETIIGDSFSRWVQSYRDLPLLINQWANVVRWEMRPRMFLRTAEFLWQEGHTAHSTEQEAREEVFRMLDVYKDVVENILGLAVIAGEKSVGERFPGAVVSTTLEAMMQDFKALQAGTSHYLGQNFSKACDIKFLNKAGEVEYAYTTSWGVSTRLIGGLIMTHSDDDGLRLPPRVAPKQIVIIPVVPSEEQRVKVTEHCVALKSELEKLSYHGLPLQIVLDARDMRGGEKSWEWVKKGIPLRIEIGPRDIEAGAVTLFRRDQGVKDRITIRPNELVQHVVRILDEMQVGYLNQAKERLTAHTADDMQVFADLKRYFAEDKAGGFAIGKSCEKPGCEDALKELAVTIRCLPLKQSGVTGKCTICGNVASKDAIFARSY